MGEPGQPPGTGPSKSLADVVRPFGKLPAGAIAFIAESLLETVARSHQAGAVGLDLRPEAITFGFESALQLAPPNTSPYYLLAPERVRGEPATPAGDLFSVGAMLAGLLTGEHLLDAGSPDATGHILLALKGPPPIFQRWPTIPGFLEKFLLALLQPDASQRPRDADAAREMLTDAVQELDRLVPRALRSLERDPRELCAQLQQAHADAEAARAQALAGAPATRTAAIVAMLRAEALTPGRPDVGQMMGYAQQAGAVRAGAPRSPELERVLGLISASEPAPNVAALKSAVALHEAEGDLLEAVGLLKRVLVLQPGDVSVRQRLDALVGPADNLWAAGGAQTVAAPIAGPEATDEAPGGGDAPSLSMGESAGSSDGPLKTALGSLGQMYGNLEPRSRLLLMAMSLSGIVGIMTMFVTTMGESPDSARRAQLHRLSLEAADCQDGGRVALVQAWQAMNLGDVATVVKITGDAMQKEQIQGGTRCHIYAMTLEPKAIAVAREKKKK